MRKGAEGGKVKETTVKDLSCYISSSTSSGSLSSMSGMTKTRFASGDPIFGWNWRERRRARSRDAAIEALTISRPTLGISEYCIRKDKEVDLRAGLVDPLKFDELFKAARAFGSIDRRRYTNSNTLSVGDLIDHREVVSERD
jgi:hypothetical protein